MVFYQHRVCAVHVSRTSIYTLVSHRMSTLLYRLQEFALVLSSTVFHFSSLFRLVSIVGLGVLRSDGPKSLAPSLALPTSFNNNNIVYIIHKWHIPLVLTRGISLSIVLERGVSLSIVLARGISLTSSHVEYPTRPHTWRIPHVLAHGLSLSSSNVAYPSRPHTRHILHVIARGYPSRSGSWHIPHVLARGISLTFWHVASPSRPGMCKWHVPHVLTRDIYIHIYQSKLPLLLDIFSKL